MTRRPSEGVGRVLEVAGRVCEAAGSASKAAGWASQAAGRYYQKHAFENRVNIMILHSTVNRPYLVLRPLWMAPRAFWLALSPPPQLIFSIFRNKNHRWALFCTFIHLKGYIRAPRSKWYLGHTYRHSGGQKGPKDGYKTVWATENVVLDACYAVINPSWGS